MFCIPTSNIRQIDCLNFNGKSILGILYRRTERAEPSLRGRVVEKVTAKEREGIFIMSMLLQAH